MLFSSCATRLCTSNTRATSGDFQHVRTNDEMPTKKSAFRDNSVDFAEPTPHGERLDGWADEFASRWVHGSGREYVEKKLLLCTYYAMLCTGSARATSTIFNI